MNWSSDTIALPTTWPERTESSIRHVISLASLANIHTRGSAAGTNNDGDWNMADARSVLGHIFGDTGSSGHGGAIAFCPAV
jgi:hypothetical protein